MGLVAALICIGFGAGEVVHVQNVTELRKALAGAKAGSTILLEPGEYTGGIFASELHGSAKNPIVIGAANPAKRPRIVGGSGMQLSDVSHIEIRDLVLSGASGNGLNIDDGGTYDTPSHHVTLRNLSVSDLPKGNNDGIKLSGVEDFLVENCLVESWGGSAIDMVGCHRGRIIGATFRKGGDSGVQCKGGTSEVTIRRSRFENYGQRGVNIGGSTGLEFFRPPVSKMPKNAAYEARKIVVEGCTFVGGAAPVAFVGVDGAVVRFNTIVWPERWAMRILQESTDGFLPSRNGVFSDNLVVLRSDAMAVNIGAGTEPSSFSFARNFWFRSDNPSRSVPQLPTVEVKSTHALDPQFIDPSVGNFRVRSGSPATRVGAHAFQP